LSIAFRMYEPIGVRGRFLKSPRSLPPSCAMVQGCSKPVNSQLPISQLPISNSQLPISNSQLPTPNRQLPTPNFQLPIPNSQLRTSNSQGSWRRPVEIGSWELEVGSWELGVASERASTCSVQQIARAQRTPVLFSLRPVPRHGRGGLAAAERRNCVGRAEEQ